MFRVRESVMVITPLSRITCTRVLGERPARRGHVAPSGRPHPQLSVGVGERRRGDKAVASRDEILNILLQYLDVRDAININVYCNT